MKGLSKIKNKEFWCKEIFSASFGFGVIGTVYTVKILPKLKRLERKPLGLLTWNDP